jgi:hypothetical protein
VAHPLSMRLDNGELQDLVDAIATNNPDNQ